MQLTETWCENHCLLLPHEKCKVIVIHETPHQCRQRERVGLPWQIMSAFPSCLITKGLRSSTNLGSFSPSCCFCGQMLAPPQSLYLLLWPSLNCGLHSTAAHALFRGLKSSRFTHGTPARESESV